MQKIILLFLIAFFYYIENIQAIDSLKIYKGLYKTTFVKDTVSNYYYNISTTICINDTIYHAPEQFMIRYFETPCGGLRYPSFPLKKTNTSFINCPFSGKALGQFPDKITCGNIYQPPTNSDTLYIMYQWEGYVQFITPKNKDCDFKLRFKCYNNVSYKPITPPLCTGYLTKYRRLTKKECKQLNVKKSKLKSFPMDYCG